MNFQKRILSLLEKYENKVLPKLEKSWCKQTFIDDFYFSMTSNSSPQYLAYIS